MGAFEIEFGRRARIRARNVMPWRVHDRVLPRVLGLGDDTATMAYTMGFAGPMFQDRDGSPNWTGADYVFDRRLALDDILHNEAGLPADDARDMEGYARQAVAWTLQRDGYGVIIDTGHHSWESRVPWAALGDCKPDDWEIEHPDGEQFYPPWRWNCLPPVATQGFPYCTPNLACPTSGPTVPEPWWAEYQNCIDPANYGGTCPTHDPQSGYPACPSCVDLDHMLLSGYPVGCAFIVLTREGFDPELFAAAVFNGPAWWRRGGEIRCRYRGRLG